jgi:IS30 family transposase
LALNRKLRTLVAGKLQQQWSPEQIAAWLKLAFPQDSTLRVSHEAIYRSLYLQARGVLKKQLQSELRTQRKMRRSKNASAKESTRGQIVDAVPISQRPPEIEDRAVPGHWEGDLICGSKNSYIATLVERHSRFTLLVKVNSKHTQTVVKALSRKIRTLPAQLRQSLTWDRGLEHAQHAQFTIETKVPVYFCDPRSPWQRGSNENTNGLLRQYFPDGTDLSEHSQRHLDKIARRLNQRPRKTLGFKTPAHVLSVSVASTG